MGNSTRKKLIECGAEPLADALLQLAEQSGRADETVARLIASPEDNEKRFKSRLTHIKRSRRFIDWKGASGFARELSELLGDLQAGVRDPMTGAQLVCSFYEADAGTIGRCDDSSGLIGDVFRWEARDLFIDYAKRCQDKAKLAKMVLRLNRKDDYGVRDTLIHHANRFLPDPVIREMIVTLQEQAQLQEDKYDKRHYFSLIESLARQVNDAPLFEKTRLASWGALSTSAYLDIAHVYFDSGDPETALLRIQKIPADESFKRYEREKLLLKIYRTLEMKEELTELLQQQFQHGYSEQTLEALLEVIGEEKRAEICQNAVTEIGQKKTLQHSDLTFLLYLKKTDEAEDHLLARAGQLIDMHYQSLLALAEVFKKQERRLATSLIYRCLLNSILERGLTRAYRHAARYLETLDELAQGINDWRGVAPHAVYVDELRQNHGRKRSFWSKYGD